MKKYVIGNWKLNPATQAESLALAQALQEIGQKPNTNTLQVGCSPSFIHLSTVAQTLKTSPIWVGSQDVSALGATGAFTGDVSAVQVADLGAKFTLIGHSERRQYHGEDDKILSQKIINAHLADLMVVLCIGESLDEYQSGLAFNVLDKQLSVLHRIDKNQINANKLIIAYEPVWAIGTGLTPTLNEIEKIHTHIKHYLHTQYGANLPILYGGSVNDKNAHDIANCQGVDGVLVGGASLKIDSFSTIIQAFS
ncbi:triose-phosphate isomerase [Moraxella oblonga]|uniref:triose-phosphate isomerase n=1 Tax=Moraxella oblonga TaxID=200413 RepID=UPI000832BBAB|nr:triose-phosphate isomerase [Moraxella oblonga]